MIIMFLKTLISRQGERARLEQDIEHFDSCITNEWLKGDAANSGLIDVISGIVTQLREELKLRDSGVWFDAEYHIGTMDDEWCR